MFPPPDSRGTNDHREACASDLSVQDVLDVSKAPESFKRHYFLRLQDLVDQLQPDLLYHDGAIRFESYGLSLVAHLYNRSAGWHGKVEAVYNSKGVEDCQAGACVLDYERGIAEGIWPNPFQTDTCIGAGTTTGKPATRRRSSASTCW